MGIQIGTSDALLYLGDQFVALYRGQERVPTVPGKPPSLTVSDPFENGNVVAFVGVPDNGGSVITDYRVYVNGVLDETAPYEEQINQRGFIDVLPGDVVTASAVNAVGEGPRSAPVTIS
jgi:hypothetical protein